MPTLFPGELQHYEGTSAQCDGEQEVREIFYDSSSGTLRYKTAAGDIVYFERVIGGNSGYIPKFLNNVTQGNSVIFESGSNIGIGLINPVDTLQVAGGMTLGTDTVTSNRTRLYESNGLHIDTGVSSRPLIFEIDSAEKARVHTNGNVGINTINPLDKLDVNGNIRASGTIMTPSGIMTPEGGFAVRLYNYTGTTSVVGQIVSASGFLGFKTAAVNDDMSIGIVYEAVANAALCWVVVAGITNVLIDAGGSTVGYLLHTSATAGSAEADATVPAAIVHFQEVGHALETRVGAGLARAMIHFN